MEKFKHAEFTMTFADEGKGRPLILIHGYPLNRHMWQPQVAGLKANNRVIAPDLRGFGESTPVSRIMSMEIYASDCLSLLEYLGIKQRIILCGLSMGGYVAMAFIRRYPDKVAGLILTATRAGADTPESRANREKALISIQQQGVESAVNSMTTKLLASRTYLEKAELVEEVKQMIASSSAEGLCGALLGMKDREDSFEMLSRYKQPALIIHGSDDQLIPVSEAKLMKHTITNSRLIIIPEAGHLPNMEQPALFNVAVSNFINCLTTSE